MHTAESQNATKGTTKLTRDKNEHETRTKPAFVSTVNGRHRPTPRRQMLSVLPAPEAAIWNPRDDSNRIIRTGDQQAQQLVRTNRVVRTLSQHADSKPRGRPRETVST